MSLIQHGVDSAARFRPVAFAAEFRFRPFRALRKALTLLPQPLLRLMGLAPARERRMRGTTSGLRADIDVRYAPACDHAADAPVVDWAHPSAGADAVRPSDENVAVRCRRLALTLMKRRSERDLRALMITAAADTPGKALVTRQLALALAQESASRVLLVDSDPHDAVPDTLAASGSATGESLSRPSSDVTRLAPIVDCVRVHDADVAARQQVVRRVLERGVEDYDWVLLNAPPLSSRSGELLHTPVRSVVVAISASTVFGSVQRLIEMLGRDRVEGTVLVDVENPV